MDQSEKLACIEVNGVSLYYAAVGEGSPILLVHGNGEDHTMFSTEIRQLVGAGYRVYAPDSRGHGANEPLQEYHYTDMAEDMYCFIKILGLEKPAYYGHSDGGIIGLLLELLHPGTLGMLACSGTNLTPEGIDPAFIREIEEINEKQKDPLLTLMLTEPKIEAEQLRQIRIPVLLTAGEKDLILLEETRKIAGHLPDVKTVIVEGADHGSYIADSEVMGELLIDFLAQNKER